MTNTYGVPRYGEANPATFAVVTFPFLFAIMFGDWGHGSLIFIVGLLLVLGNDYMGVHDGMRGVLPFRYLVFMMGFFSMYMGLLYNEFFAIPSDWFGTCYNDDLSDPLYKSAIDDGGAINFLPKGYKGIADENENIGRGCTYLFG